jgi:hypothetical protein
VKRVGNFGFFPHLEIGQIEQTPADILDSVWDQLKTPSIQQ